jgi:hypothetical protein
VQAFPTPHGKWQISTNGGLYPRWRHDGRELFYVDLAGHLMATPISMNADQQSIDAGVPTPLFSPRLASGGVILNPGALARPVYAVAADGRFLLNEAADDAGRDTASLTAVLNWDAGLKR